MALRKRAIQAVINADAEIQYFYANAEGQTCAIGGLAKAAGVDMETLLAAGMTGIAHPRKNGNTTNEAYRAVLKIRRAVGKRFGLTIEEMRAIQNRNDWSRVRADRQAAINSFVRSLTR